MNRTIGRFLNRRYMEYVSHVHGLYLANWMRITLASSGTHTIARPTHWIGQTVVPRYPPTAAIFCFYSHISCYTKLAFVPKRFLYSYRFWRRKKSENVEATCQCGWYREIKLNGMHCIIGLRNIAIDAIYDLFLRCMDKARCVFFFRDMADGWLACWCNSGTHPTTNLTHHCDHELTQELLTRCPL